MDEKPKVAIFLLTTVASASYDNTDFFLISSIFSRFGPCKATAVGADLTWQRPRMTAAEGRREGFPPQANIDRRARADEGDAEQPTAASTTAIELAY